MKKLFSYDPRRLIVYNIYRNEVMEACHMAINDNFYICYYWGEGRSKFYEVSFEVFKRSIDVIGNNKEYLILGTI